MKGIIFVSAQLHLFFTNSSTTCAKINEISAVQLVMYAFEPLKQSLDVISKGGSVGVFSGDISKISEVSQIPIQI